MSPGKALIAMAMAGLASAAVAAAPDSGEAHDTQCLLVTAALAGGEDKAMQKAGEAASLFFMGKLYGRNPDYDMVAAAKPYLTTLDEARIRTLLTECGTELSQRGDQTAEAGKAIGKLEK